MNAMYFHPLFDEQKCSYRFSYCLKESMARKNHILMRQDYRGTGDSECPFECVTMETLRQDVGSAISKPSNVLIGLRFGASLICDYFARRQSPAHRIILIEPIIDGHAYVEYMSRKQKLKDRLSKVPPHFCQDDKYVNIEGYKTSKCFLDQVKAFTLDSCLDICGVHEIMVICTRRVSGHNRLRFLDQGKSRIVHIPLPDIWERIPMIDYSPLVNEIIGWCNEG